MCTLTPTRHNDGIPIRTAAEAEAASYGAKIAVEAVYDNPWTAKGRKRLLKECCGCGAPCVYKWCSACAEAAIRERSRLAKAAKRALRKAAG